MAKKKVLNIGKVMVILGAVIILVLVALWCGSLLKLTHEQKNADPNAVVTQSTISVNVISPPTTTTVTVATTEAPIIPVESTTEETTEDELMVKGNGEFQEYIIKLANPALDIHSEPSYNSTVTGTITDRGSYNITKETIDDDGNKWGLIDADTSFGWINLMDARKTDPEDIGGAETTTENNSDNSNNVHNHDVNSNGDGSSGELMGVDADGDGWDDGFNPDAWCAICGYDSYYNSSDGNYHCSQGHVWNY